MSIWIAQGSAGYGHWLASFLLIGSLYGGGFGVIPAFVSDLFGSKISAATHGIMIAVWAAAAIIGIPVFTTFTSTDFRLVGTTKVTNPSAYIHNAHWLCALPAAGFIAALFIHVRPRDRELRAAKGDVRARVFGLIVRFSAAEGGVAVFGPAAQAAEYAAFAAARGKAAAAELELAGVAAAGAVA